MRNKILVTALGVCLAVTSVIFDYTYTNTLYEERVKEYDTYAALNADPHMEYNGYTVEQLGNGYDKPVNVFGRAVIDVPIINQYPEMPVGCEPVCAVSVIQYLGFETDKFDFTDNYLIWDDNFYYDENMVSHGPDPNRVFAGDPYKWGYGCSSNVLAKAMNRYFSAQNADYTALSFDEEINSADIEKLINEGVPLIVWATIDMKPMNYRKPSEWIIDATGEEYCWYGNSHTLVLCGYDNNCYYFMDPNDKDEVVQYLKSSFLNRFEDNGYQAIAVKIGRD